MPIVADWHRYLRYSKVPKNRDILEAAAPCSSAMKRRISPNARLVPDNILFFCLTFRRLRIDSISGLARPLISGQTADSWQQRATSGRSSGGVPADPSSVAEGWSVMSSSSLSTLTVSGVVNDPLPLGSGVGGNNRGKGRLVVLLTRKGSGERDVVDPPVEGQGPVMASVGSPVWPLCASSPGCSAAVLVGFADSRPGGCSGLGSVDLLGGWIGDGRCTRDGGLVGTALCTVSVVIKRGALVRNEGRHLGVGGLEVGRGLVVDGRF